MQIFAALMLAVVVLLGCSSVATAEPPPPEPNWLVLKPSKEASGAPFNEESGAELVLSSCAFASKGRLVENKAVLDTLKFNELFTNHAGKENCEATAGSEAITEATVSTSGEGSNATLTYKGSMKYRTTSPACTYSTPEYIGEFSRARRSDREINEFERQTDRRPRS
jgi:hypothetical protein